MSKKLTWVAGIGAALASGVAVAVIFADRGPNVEALAKKYQATGMPWTAKDLPDLGEVTDSENAAPLIRESMAVWPRMRGSMEFSFRSDPKDKEEAEAILERMKNLEPSLALAKQASEKPYYDPGWDWDIDLNKVVPELQGIRLMVRALCQKGDALLTVGEDKKAMEAWKSALNLTLLSRSLPDSSAALLASTMSASVSRAAVRAMDRKPKDNSLLAELVSGLKKLDAEPDWRTAVKADGYAYLATLRNSVNVEDAAGRLQPEYAVPEGQKTILVREGIPASPDLKEMTAGVLATYAELGAALDSNTVALPDFILLTEKLEDDAGSGGESRSLSSLSRTLRRIGASMGHAKAALALALIMQQKAEGGEEVKNLDSLAGGPWLDPLSGLPLKISYRPERIKIWSIGANLADDGGLSRDEASAASQNSQTDHIQARAYDEVAAFPFSLPQPKADQRSNPHVQWLDATKGGPAVLNIKSVRSQAMMVDSAMGAHAPGPLGLRRTTGLEGSL